MSGAFQTSREIFENPIWQNIVEFRLFFLIYGKAIFSEEGYKQGSVFIGKGQWLRSYRNLQSDLEYIENRSVKRYSLSRIKRAIDSLVKNERIEIKETELGTLFTVVNYAKYQGLDNYKKHNENAERTQRERRENAERTQREQQRNNNKKEKKDKKDKKEYIPVPYQEIIDLYNQTCTSLPKVIKLTEKRRRAIKARWGTYKNLDDYEKVFQMAQASDFLSGRNGKWTSCNFDWLINENNMVKVLEGNYENKEQPKQGLSKKLDFAKYPQHEISNEELEGLFEKIEVEEMDHG